MLQDAIVEFLLGNFQQAQNVAEQVLTVAPNLPQALLVAGHSAFQLAQFETARVHLGSYLVHNPQDHQARLALGLPMITLGYPKEASGTPSAPAGGQTPE